MFEWLFAPSCPCDPEAKRWVEDRLRWLSRQFGLHILLERPVILPTDEFFPDPYDGSPEAVQKMFRRVCRFMEVNPRNVDLRFYADRTPGSVAALDPSRGFAADGFGPPGNVVGCVAFVAQPKIGIVGGHANGRGHLVAVRDA